VAYSEIIGRIANSILIVLLLGWPWIVSAILLSRPKKWSNLLFKWLEWRYPKGRESFTRRMTGLDSESARLFWIVFCGIIGALIGIPLVLIMVREVSDVWR
jgi:hypothetical protein